MVDELFKSAPEVLCRHDEYTLVWHEGKLWVVDLIECRKCEVQEVNYED